MQILLADPLFGGAAQGGRHLIELLAAFALTALVGLNARFRARSRDCGPRLAADTHDIDSNEVGVTMTLSGAKILDATEVLAQVDGVYAVLRAEDEAD